MHSTITLIDVALLLYSAGITFMFIRTTKSAERKERIIRRLNNKVLDYRHGVHDLNDIARAEKQDDDVL